jgi:hypothetical protein
MTEAVTPSQIGFHQRTRPTTGRWSPSRASADQSTLARSGVDNGRKQTPGGDCGSDEHHRQRASERVQLEFDGMGSGWFTIRFVVALSVAGAAAIA